MKRRIGAVLIILTLFPFSATGQDRKNEVLEEVSELTDARGDNSDRP